MPGGARSLASASIAGCDSTVRGVRQRHRAHGDRCADLVIGAPGRAGAGVVVIALGNPTGYRAADARLVAAPQAASAGAFGTSLAVIHHVGTSGTQPVLVVGMPGYVVGRRPACGAVVAIPVPAGVPGTPVVAAEDAAGVAGAAETGDVFGQVLTAEGARRCSQERRSRTAGRSRMPVPSPC